MRITTPSQLGHRITVPMPWAYTRSTPIAPVAPQLAHFARATVRSGTNSSLRIPAAAFPSTRFASDPDLPADPDFLADSVFRPDPDFRPGGFFTVGSFLKSKCGLLNRPTSRAEAFSFDECRLITKLDQ
jgi:hypothetical protein